MPQATLRQNFQNPPSAYRTMPLWVWNDEMDPARMTEQLRQFKAQGIGGVFVHPRPGLMTEYLGKEWFERWKTALEVGRQLGLEVDIYDENSYPGGFAGGKVPSMAPDTVVQYVTYELRSTVPWTNGEMVAAYAVRTDATGNPAEARRVKEKSGWTEGAQALVFTLGRQSGRPWTAGFPYVDLTHPDTTRVFLKSTYEPYLAQVGAEFGRTVKWAFNDEPQLGVRATNQLLLTRYIAAEFRKRCGYDLLDTLPSLFWDLGDYRKVRFDYWQTVHDLWKENFFVPMRDWCAKHGIGFTGHWMEHEWPYPWISPDDASYYAFEHMPGIDLLEGNNLRLTGQDPHMLFTVKQMTSVSNQLGRRAFVEAYGVAGWDSTFEHYKRVGDWLLVHGINFLDQHLSFTTIRGARKRDHPQSFSDVSPWWPHYRLHADHTARVSYLMSQGEARNRVAILEPTTSGFLNARRNGPTPELDAMKAHYGELVQYAADHQMDFDLADEYILEWYGKAAAGKLTVAKANYQLVVWPRDMENVRGATVKLLESYLASGGQVVALSKPAVYVDGRANDAVARLAEKYAAQWHTVSGLDEMLAEVRRRVAPRVRFEAAMPTGVAVGERYLAGGQRAVFFTNTGLETVKTRIRVEGGAVEDWDTVTGRVAPAVFTKSGGEVAFELELPPAGSRLVMVKAAGAPAVEKAAPAVTVLQATAGAVQAAALNVLPLDYCDLTVRGAEYKDINTWRANWNIWQAHGFERPAWDNAVQFERRVYDRNHFGKDTGFEATFRFEVADAAALEKLELAVELPALYRVRVNGKPVDFTRAARWLDPHLKSVGIAGLARVGENTVTVAAKPFDVRMELETIFLRGNFKVAAAAKGFRLVAPGPLGLGSWAAQGYPFYGDTVRYTSGVEVPAGTRRLRVRLGEWSGSVALVRLDGRKVATLGWQPYEAEFAVAPGKHQVTVEVVSTPRNTLGPFHHPAKLRMKAWPGAWGEFPDRQPAGEAYDVLGYGLMTAPVVEALR
jgi:hypothetical protein